MKKFFVFLLVVICLGMGVGVVYMKSSEDNEGPKITFEEGKDTNYTSDMTEEDLLKDVKAQAAAAMTAAAKQHEAEWTAELVRRALAQEAAQ